MLRKPAVMSLPMCVPMIAWEDTTPRYRSTGRPSTLGPVVWIMRAPFAGWRARWYALRRSAGQTVESAPQPARRRSAMTTGPRKPFAIIGQGTIFDGIAYWTTLIGVYVMVGGDL